MKKWARIILIAAGSLVALLLLAFILINTPFNKLIVKKFATEYIDGTLDYDRLKISLIPRLGVKIDSLCLISDEDTLASFSELRVSVKLREMMHGRYDIAGLTVRNLYVHYRTLGDGTNNWQVFRGSGKEKDTVSVHAFPRIDLGLLDFPDARAKIELDRLGTFDVPFDMSAKAKGGPAEAGDGMDLSLDNFNLRIDSSALGMNVKAKVDDFLGVDPHFDINAEADLSLDKLNGFIPRSFGIASAAGDLQLGLKADALQSEFQTFKFQKAEIEGFVKGDRFFTSLPADSLNVRTWKPDLHIRSDSEGLGLNAGFDSLYVEKGSIILARARGMDNAASVTKVESRGNVVPRLALSTGIKRLFVQMGTDRIFTRDVDVALSAQKHVSIVQDTARLNRPMRPGPVFLEDPSLESGDVTFSLDSTLTNYLKEWDILGKLTMDNVGFISPRMPLRTRVFDTGINFTGNEVNIDSLHLISGTSNLSINGTVRGLRRALLGGGLLRADMHIDSKRLNINEIIAAFQRGEYVDGVVAVEDEEDESFVVDSLSTEGSDTLKTGLVIVPGNIMASVSLEADEINFKDIEVDSLTSVIRMQERTVQLTQTGLTSNYGKIKLDAFYSTRSKRDINAGIDIKVSDVSAAQIIGLMPQVDNMMPALKSFHGILGCQVTATTQLDTNMNVLMPTLDGLIKISGEDLEVRDAGNLKKITRLLLFKDKNIGHIDNLYVNAVVHDNKLEVFPFELGVDRYRLALYGMQGFDKTMYYHISILKSPFLIRFGINMYGTPDNWRFRLCLPKYRSGHVPAFEDELDNVHVNISKSIRNIFREGVEGVRRYNRRSMDNLDRSKKLNGFSTENDGGELSLDDQTKVMDMVIDNDFAEAEKALEEEVDAILQKSYKDTEKVMKEYADQAYERGISEQIEKLKAQSEKKKASKK
ncbi:MAG: hypothetical protein MJY89_05470 [Bacteroidales bacterium]|nr:hypothetical protein [Bacteroidales bacterium]